MDRLQHRPRHSGMISSCHRRRREAEVVSPNEARRGAVSKTFYDVNALAGFMDEAHFQAFAQEYIASLPLEDQPRLLEEAERARAFVAGLPPHEDYTTEVRAIDLTDRFADHSAFNAAFGALPVRFAWIRPENVVAVQVFVNSQQEAVPTSEEGLIDFALPVNSEVPVEISFIPPQGPIYLVSSSPHFAGLGIQLDSENHRVIIQPPPHVNLIQVCQLGGRYYLRNGYHRVVGALRAGIAELPALVVDANQPPDVELPQLGPASFSVLRYIMSLGRPPLVADFGGEATVNIRMRERRYGASVSFQISPLNIGV
jgi:hypothetical protein